MGVSESAGVVRLLSVPTITKALEDEAFEIYTVEQDRDIADLDLEKGYGLGWAGSSAGLSMWLSAESSAINESERKRQRHAEQCEHCQAEKGGMREHTPVPAPPDDTNDIAPKRVPTKAEAETRLDDGSTATTDPVVLADSLSPAPSLLQASLAIGGMTCSSCVGTISDTLGQHGWIRSVSVNLLNNSASVLFEGKWHISDIVKAIEDCGYEATLEHVEEISTAVNTRPRSTTNNWRATFAIGGMTCSSCVGMITKTVQQLEWVETVEVNLISNCATVVFKGKEHLASILQAIEDVGYEASLDDLARADKPRETGIQRKVAIQVVGMYCSHCPPRISDALNKSFGEKVQVERLPTTSDPILRISYIPNAPDFTIRQIIASIAAVDAAFEPYIYHPPSLEQRSQQMRAREQRRILLRLALSIVVAIPTFIVGIVLMNLVSSSNPSRQFIMKPIWAGHVSRADWALFIMATPVYFFAADIFHVRAFKELWAMWRPRSTTPLLRRFYRFGSMNLLISLGTTIAYFSSIVELALAATQATDTASMAAGSSYFDSVVFLTMFLLIGRFLEAYSKAKTGDAVTLLGKLRPTDAILIDPVRSPTSTPSRLQPAEPTTHKTPVDLLDVGDTVKVLHGASPPSDGTIVQGEARFDESSLTGESQLVAKGVGNGVFAGTVNEGGPIFVRISNVSGMSMLDQIVKVVREGQARRAPIERVADVITSHFVPLVVLIGVSTWIVWLALGLSGTLPASYRDTNVGGWPLWSLRFSIAVFVIACPCGIGLAAPTALFVGGGLAAQHGILVKGGGEAFQEASALDYIVFDKTGTLTEGGEPTVTGYECFADDDKTVLGMVRRLENSSSHPVAKALASFCDAREVESSSVSRITEIPGKGMSGMFMSSTEDQLGAEIILGNEALMSDYDVEIGPHVSTTLDAWKEQGKSVALFAVCMPLEPLAAGAVDSRRTASWQLSAAFAVSDQIRPEAAAVVRALQSRGVEVWMLSGDNLTTARAVGRMVGINERNVIAGVLPDQKGEKIRHLQQTSVRKGTRGAGKRAIVAMVGDGINDAPALTIADVGIAIGSGTDVAISSAEFVLMSSRLTSLLALIDLSRTVFRRVRFNFAWALVYNLVALPVAAGALYPLKSNGTHVRLDPVWASLAMALSSISVVCSSLFLKSKLPGVGFRTAEIPQRA
jgi:heavy metal translocating P-type ATPase